MNAVRSIVLACLCCLLLGGAASSAPFVSAKGYSVTPAPGWKVKTGMMGADVFIFAPPTNGFAPNLNVFITPAQPGQTLASGQKQIAAVYPQMFTQFKLVQSGYETVGGVRALRVVGTYLQGTRHLRMHQALVLRGGSVYTFTCTSQEASHARTDPAFAQMLQTVRWSK